MRCWIVVWMWIGVPLLAGGVWVERRPGLQLEQVQRLCGAEVRSLGALPAERYLSLAEELAGAGPDVLRRRICAAQARQEVALGLAWLGVLELRRGRAQGSALLHTAADVLGDPFAMVILGEGYLHGRWGLARDPRLAWRYLQAALVVCDQDRRLAGSLGVEIRGLLTSFALLPLDPEVERAAARAFIAQRLEAHRSGLATAQAADQSGLTTAQAADQSGLATAQAADQSGLATAQAADQSGLATAQAARTSRGCAQRSR